MESDKRLETLCRALQKENEALRKQLKSSINQKTNNSNNITNTSNPSININQNDNSTFTTNSETLESLLTVLELQRDRISFLEEGNTSLFD